MKLKLTQTFQYFFGLHLPLPDKGSLVGWLGNHGDHADKVDSRQTKKI